KRTVMTALALSTVVAVAMGAMALAAKSRAEDERSAAQFQQVVALADALRESDPTTSAQLSLAAWRMRPGSDDAFSRLVATETTPISRSLTGHTGPVYGVAFSADGRTLATASDDRSVRLWDLADGSVPVQIGQELTGPDRTSTWRRSRSAPTGISSRPAAATARCGSGTSVTGPRREH
ncbi:WD40 repeat domain-containing protein, partial [Streptomyces koyangensis]